MAINEDKTQRQIVRYSPNPPPKGKVEPEILAHYLFQELKRISYVIDNLSKNRFEVLYEYPEKPREGDVIYADGVNLNPTGSGRPGLFFYTSYGQWQ